MAPDQITIDYEAVNDVAIEFETQSQVIRQVLQNLQNTLSVLRATGWLGKGADAFYHEMDDDILPQIQRLAEALATTSNSLHTVSDIMKEAEEMISNSILGTV